MAYSVEQLEQYLAASRQVRKRVAWIAIAGFVATLALAFVNGTAAFITGVSSGVLLGIGAYITTMRIAEWNAELHRLRSGS